jgi:hypothetical protein
MYTDAIQLYSTISYAVVTPQTSQPPAAVTATTTMVPLALILFHHDYSTAHILSTNCDDVDYSVVL